MVFSRMCVHLSSRRLCCNWTREKGRQSLATAYVSDFHDDANRNINYGGSTVTPGTSFKIALLKCRGMETNVKAEALAAELASGEGIRNVCPIRSSFAFRGRYRTGCSLRIRSQKLFVILRVSFTSCLRNHYLPVIRKEDPSSTYG